MNAVCVLYKTRSGSPVRSLRLSRELQTELATHAWRAVRAEHAPLRELCECCRDTESIVLLLRSNPLQLKRTDTQNKFGRAPRRPTKQKGLPGLEGPPEATKNRIQEHPVSADREAAAGN